MATSTVLPTPAGTMHKFVPLLKVDVAKREVWGIATEETEDRSGETLDYETSAPLFRDWSAAASKATGGKSLGNIREMHGSIAAGKVIDLDCNDARKCITIGTKIIDDQSWAKVEEGVLTGFSIGGSYAKVWKKGNKTMYTGKPAEISLVDLPCLPTATFEVVKADGSTEFRKFAESVQAPPPVLVDPEALAKRVAELMDERTKLKKAVAGEELGADAFAHQGDAAKPETWRLPIKSATASVAKSRVRSALNILGNPRHRVTKSLTKEQLEAAMARVTKAADEAGVKHGEEVEKAIRADYDARIAKTAEGRGLKKDLYSVGQFAQLLQSLFYLYRSSVYEAEVEQDGSIVPDELMGHLDELAETFLTMAEEEVNELTAAAAAKGEMYMSATAEGLLKASRANLANHFRKTAGSNLALAKHHNTLAGLHKAQAEAFSKSEGDDAAKTAAKVQEDFHTKAAASHTALAFTHTNDSVHAEKMVKACDEDETVAKAAGDDIGASLTKAADVIDPNAPAPSATAVAAAAVASGDDAVAQFAKTQMQELGLKMVKDGIEAAKNDPEVQKAYTEAAKAQLLGSLGDTLKPTETKVVLQPRAGQPTTEMAKSAASASPDYNDTGL